jgi:hypothetical protein
VNSLLVFKKEIIPLPLLFLRKHFFWVFFHIANIFPPPPLFSFSFFLWVREKGEKMQRTVEICADMCSDALLIAARDNNFINPVTAMVQRGVMRMDEFRCFATDFVPAAGTNLVTQEQAPQPQPRPHQQQSSRRQTRPENGLRGFGGAAMGMLQAGKERVGDMVHEVSRLRPDQLTLPKLGGALGAWGSSGGGGGLPFLPAMPGRRGGGVRPVGGMPFKPI